MGTSKEENEDGMADFIESTGTAETNVLLELLRDNLPAAQQIITNEITSVDLSELRSSAVTAVELIDEEFRARKRRQQGGGASR